MLVPPSSPSGSNRIHSAPVNRVARFIPYTQEGCHRSPITPSAETQAVSTPVRQPASIGWLEHPAWIDGGVNPPQFYFSHDEISETRRAYGYSELVWDTEAGALPDAETEPATTSASNLDVDLELPVPTKEYVVNVGVAYKAPASTGSTRSKAQSQKKELNKIQHIAISPQVSRADFIKSCLQAVELDKTYEPSDVQGPQFKLWWKGLSGGKAKAPGIDTNSNWVDVRAMLLAKKDAEVLVEFQLTELERYRSHRPLDASINPSTELLHGTQVPVTAQFTEMDQLHGSIIVKLKKQWMCNGHSGEHGEVGHCYVSPTGEHYGLNMRKLKMWAAGIAAHDYTLREPPPIMLDGGSHDADGPRPRGHTGPKPAQVAAASSDSSALMATVAMLLVDRLSQTSSTSTPATITPLAASSDTATSTKKSEPKYPIPLRGKEIESCLTVFHQHRKIDLLSAESSLAAADYTPDIVPYIDLTRLADLLGVPEGTAKKFQKFCELWNTEIESYIV